MADAEIELSAQLKSLTRQYESRKARNEVESAAGNEFVEDLLRRLAEMEQKLKNAQLDLTFETDGRRRWQERATLVEGKIQGAQHMLVLIDGNQHFFKDAFLRAGAMGVKNAVQPFVDEVRQLAKDQHKHDLPENTILMVHVFSDIDQLAKDLQNAGLLPDPSTLLDFCQELCRTQTYFTFSDCGPRSQTVATKVEKIYELYIENCHCRHIFLALGHESEYYKTLMMYNDDDYTKGKTSLIRPELGFPSGVNLAYQTVDISSLQSIPRGATDPKPHATGSTLNGWGNHASDTEKPQQSNNAKPTTVNRQFSGGSIAKVTTEKPATPPVVKISRNAEEHVVADRGQEEDQATTEEVQLASTAHSSSSSNKTVEQTWETRVSENSYSHGPIQGAWGEEDIVPIKPASNGWENPSASPRPSSTYGQPYMNGKTNGRSQYSGPTWRRNDLASSSMGSAPPRRVPAEFDGSWDEIVSNEEPKAPTSRFPHNRDQSNASSNRTSNGASTSSRLTASAFRRQTVDVPEPSPDRRPVWSPVAVNEQGQRIDLQLPKPSLNDAELFSIRTQNRKLCNYYHLNGTCDHTECPYDHEPISAGVYIALRGKARKLPCHTGPSCRKHNCFAGHHCPNVGNVTKCGRMNCPFKHHGMHEIKNFDIVEMIQPPPES